MPSQRTSISEFVKRAYLAYFKLKIRHQDKSWAQLMQTMSRKPMLVNIWNPCSVAEAE